MRLKINALALALSPIILVAASGAAQSQDSTFFFTGGPSGTPLQTKAATIALKMETMDAAPVKGAPFCATVSTEHTQLLADGNRIHTTESSQLCRDSEGRTRREAGLNLLGAAPQGTAPKLITIVDPVAGVRYLLDAGSKTAQKMTLSPGGGAGGPDKAGAPGAPGKGENVFFFQGSGGSGEKMVFRDVVVNKNGDSSESAPNSENLGDQNIDGIHASGTRVTTTIPAGQMGNEKPIVVTSERWYSPELKVTVMTKHDDPWAGELKTEFKNVSTAEPDASLFAVPADYNVVDDKEGPIRIKIAAPAPPAQ
ncbi:MAG TPA: hypothetical protein VFE61_24130 [Candidatus Sulfotelmatobacter sp.]|nr:hypothetical protein [Candidatus Sulfotelmatobacter sp.]